MVVGSANFIHENGKVELVGAPRYNQTGHDIMYELMTWRVHPVLWGTPWAKLIRREWLAQSDIIYRPGMQKYEDTECIVRNLPRIESFCSIDTPVYNYYLNDGSATARFRGERQLSDAKRLYISQCEAINSLFDGERREKLLDDVTRELSFTYLSMIYVLYRTSHTNRFNSLKKICNSIDTISPHWKAYFKSGNPLIVRRTMKLGLWATHLLLSAVALVPALRKQLRG